ncbi:MAG: baseplate J/gp47 family protein [Candidatus Loosdrechtia sp.]|uniref:baseplate J/gp47 family protein n=1 Tax=Candidatus Loosdrechtia sp. TaxID=3101272 RepID=UPI003A684138|nr:MAG: baseplate J/gp47 family protein [Candidatus Jettenia sp. AMX2]
MAIKNQEALHERANSMAAKGLNGIKLVLVTLHPSTNPAETHLEVHFYNNHEIANILADLKDPKLIFPITGGQRIPAGPGTDQVKVVSLSGNPADNFLILTVAPVGDYTTYTLHVDYQNIDLIFNEINFKFRPGCFNLCAPEWESAPEPEGDPVIDYLAKDYDSFKHTMITAMMERVPGWEPTSEADLDQVILEMFSVAADELSDYQDRVMNEAYLGTARKRVSLARHARLMDYHIHQGNQASTLLALKVADGEEFDLEKGFMVWAGDDTNSPSSVVFVTKKKQHMHHLFNQMGLYTWSDSIPALKAGSVTADLKLNVGGEAAANTVRDFIRNGTVTHLLVQEWLNPATGKEAGRDPAKRQILKLLPGEEGTVTMKDPLTGQWFVRIRWEEKDKLKSNYCFTVNCPHGKAENISLFHGNLVMVCHGRPAGTVFREEGTILSPGEFYYERTKRWGTVCRLPEGPLAYQESTPGGEFPPESTLTVEVETPGSGRDKWDEVISLVHSDDSDEHGDHFIAETDEEGRSLVRFGNGMHGRKLPEGAVVYCSYQTGRGTDGNIGADKLMHYDKTVFPKIEECWNPLDVSNGRDPEPVKEIIRRVPEAYRFRQLRAVTLKDYEDRAEELPDVSRAAARYAWTGSWRTVQIAVDPAGTAVFTEELREKIARYLDAVRLIGEDLEIRPPLFVPLKIHVSLCIHPDYWPEDIKEILEQEFSGGFTPDGRMGFFHPDLWTFGQELRTSQITGRVQTIRGVDHVISVIMHRWSEATPGVEGIITVRANEIIQVRNDRDHIEKGFIFFDVRGGRQ